MAINRVLRHDANDQHKKKINQQIQEGLNPVDEFLMESRQKVSENLKKLDPLWEEANDVIREAKATGDLNQRVNALKVASDILAKKHKIGLELQQYFTVTSDRLDREAFEQKGQVNKLLGLFVQVIEENICSECKKRTIPKVIKLIELDGVTPEGSIDKEKELEVEKNG